MAGVVDEDLAFEDEEDFLESFIEDKDLAEDKDLGGGGGLFKQKRFKTFPEM